MNNTSRTLFSFLLNKDRVFVFTLVFIILFSTSSQTREVEIIAYLAKIEKTCPNSVKCIWLSNLSSSDSNSVQIWYNDTTLTWDSESFSMILKPEFFIVGNRVRFSAIKIFPQTRWLASFIWFGD